MVYNVKWCEFVGYSGDVGGFQPGIVYLGEIAMRLCHYRCGGVTYEQRQLEDHERGGRGDWQVAVEWVLAFRAACVTGISCTFF